MGKDRSIVSGSGIAWRDRFPTGDCIMLDGVLVDWQRDEPVTRKPTPWLYFAVFASFATLSLVAAILYPEVFAAGLERF
jgi:hypothetical protein